MNRLVTTFSRLALVAAVAFAFTSCTQEDTTTGPGTSGNGPTSIAANSRSATAVGIAWHRQSTDVSADTVIATANGVEVRRVVTSSTDTAAVVDGLTLNTLYNFSVHSTGGSSASITWAPAIRTQMVRLYETADNTGGHYSGLVLNGNEVNQGQNAVAVSTADAAQYHLNADIVFASDQTNTNSFLTIVSPAVTSISGIESGKYTKFSNPYQDPVAGRATGMDDIYYTGDLRSTITTSGTSIVNAIELTTTTNQNPLVFNALTADNHFARIEVMPQASNGGRLYGGTAGHNYIDVMVSYQPLLNSPYAGRPAPMMSNVPPIRWRTN